MESNKNYHYFFKYAFLGAGFILLKTSFVSWFFPQLIRMNGEQLSQDLFVTVLFGLIGVAMILIFLTIKDKFVMARLGSQTVTLKKSDWELKTNWMEVESISLIQFVYPPLYKIKVKGSEETYWFNTESQFMKFGGVINDLSEMGNLVKKKKRELGI
ncbi:hypothetical protein ACFSKL_04000 [Belliella marina]|uniref:PH domain-containing protein n=1 Tax=Belliella marina TaxID=1644146 RepID=A0ABW4VGW8_9BACT